MMHIICLIYSVNLNKNRTPLIAACFASSAGATKCVEYLLSENAKARESVEGTTTGGTRAIHFAASHDDATQLELLLNLGNADPMAPSNAGPPLSWAAGHASNAACAQVLLATKKVQVDYVNQEDGMTALILACFRGNAELAKLLCENGANTKVFARNMSALAASAISGSEECVRAVLSHGGKELLEMRDPVDNLRAIDVAAHCENEPMVELLAKEMGIQVDAKAYVAELKKQEEERAQEADRAIKTDEEGAMKVKEEGNALFTKGEYEAAAKLYFEAASNYPKCTARTRATLFANASASYGKLNKWTEARDAARQSVDADKTYQKGHFRLGQACTQLLEHEDAARAYWDAKEVETKPAERQNLMKLFQKEIELGKAKYKREQKTDN
jgi:ankyrin repeat protein